MLTLITIVMPAVLRYRIARTLMLPPFDAFDCRLMLPPMPRAAMMLRYFLRLR